MQSIRKRNIKRKKQQHIVNTFFKKKQIIQFSLEQESPTFKISMFPRLPNNYSVNYESRMREVCCPKNLNDPVLLLHP